MRRQLIRTTCILLWSTKGGNPVGKAKFSNGLFFSAQKDCVLIEGSNVTDIKFLSSDINGCNESNGGFGGINLIGVSGEINILGNTFCEVSNYGGAFPMAYGVKVGAGTGKTQIVDNSFWDCTARVVNVSTGNVMLRANNGPSNASMGSCGGNPGLQGNEQHMTISVGTGTPSRCVVNFGSGNFSKAPTCVVSPGPGSVAISSIATTQTQLTINGTKLSGTYFAICQD